MSVDFRFSRRISRSVAAENSEPQVIFSALKTPVSHSTHYGEGSVAVPSHYSGKDFSPAQSPMASINATKCLAQGCLISATSTCVSSQSSSTANSEKYDSAPTSVLMPSAPPMLDPSAALVGLQSVHGGEFSVQPGTTAIRARELVPFGLQHVPATSPFLNRRTYYLAQQSAPQ